MAAPTRQRRRGIFYGYLMLPGLMAVDYLGYWSYLGTFAVYIRTLAADFGWTRGALSGAYSIGAMAMGFGGPIWGVAIDRFGVRKLLVLGAALSGAALWGCSQITEIWMLYAFWILVMIAPAFTTHVACTKVVATWFLKRRTTMMGFLVAAAGFVYMGAALVGFFIVEYGWRTSFRIQSVVIAAGITALAILVVRNRPEDKGWGMDGAEPVTQASAGSATDEGPSSSPEAVAAGQTQFTIWQALRTPAFWYLSIAGLSLSIASNLVLIHSTPYLEDMGYPKIIAASILGYAGIVSVFGRLTGGWICDRAGRNAMRFIYAGAILSRAAGLLIFTQVATYGFTALWAYVMLYGLGLGIAVPTVYGLIASYFGYEAYATINLSRAFIVRIGTGIGPFLGGVVWDMTGEYFLAYVAGAACMVLGALLIIFAVPPKEPIGTTRRA